MEYIKDVIKSLLTEDGDLNTRETIERFPFLSKYTDKEVRNVIAIALFKDMICSDIENLKAYNDWVCDMPNNTQYTLTTEFTALREFVCENINSVAGEEEFTVDQVTDDMVVTALKSIMALALKTDISEINNIKVEETVLGKMCVATQNVISPLVMSLIK